MLVLVLAAFAAGGLSAQEAPHSQGERLAEGNAAQAWNEGGGLFSAFGGGLMFDASRSRNSDGGHFWSQIYAGSWVFADAGPFEVSFGLGFGRMARESRWCIPLLAANASLFWKMPIVVLDISTFLGIGFDAVFWARSECVRSDVVLADIGSGNPFREFSSLKFKLGFGRDFELREDRFFRARLIGYYGMRRLSNPRPIGGTLRLGVGRRL